MKYGVEKRELTAAVLAPWIRLTLALVMALGSE
jgi:hypothetical protein